MFSLYRFFVPDDNRPARSVRAVRDDEIENVDMDLEDRPARSVRAVRDDDIESVDMDLEDSDFEPGADTELLGLFFPEVCTYN